MDLGIRGRRALVCASSKGLGRGCAEALAAEGAAVTLVARGGAGLDAAGAALVAKGAEARGGAMDLSARGSAEANGGSLPHESPVVSAT